MIKTSSQLPSIWTYQDCRTYVSDLCEWKRVHEENFSYRQLSRFADLGSPNYIQTYIHGKRNLKADTAKRLAEAFGLTGPELQFFLLLVRYTQSRRRERRELRLEVLRLAVRHGGTGRLDAARLEYFTQWFIPVIHTMASLRGFKPDPGWIALRIVPAIGPAEAQRALDILFELHIFQGAREAFRVCEPRLETEPELQSSFIREYHRAMIRLSEQSIDTWDAEKRITTALTVTVPHAMIGDVRKRVDAFRRETFEWLMAAQEDDTDGVDGEVVQMNFQVFPLSRTGGEESQS